MADEKNPAKKPTDDENAPDAASELSDGQLDQVTGGKIALPSQVAQVAPRSLIDDDGPRLP